MSSGSRSEASLPSAPGIIPCGPSFSISTPTASSSSGLILLSWQRNSRTAACVQPCSMQKPACSGPRIMIPWPPLPVENVDGVFIAVANVRRMPSASPFSCWASCRTPSTGIRVTVVSPGS